MYEGLQLVIGLAVTDQRFMGSFMDDRPRALVGLPLSEPEAGVLFSTPARGFIDLSRKLDSWITRSTRPLPLAMAVAVGAEEWA